MLPGAVSAYSPGAVTLWVRRRWRWSVFTEWVTEESRMKLKYCTPGVALTVKTAPGPMRSGVARICGRGAALPSALNNCGGVKICASW